MMNGKRIRAKDYEGCEGIEGISDDLLELLKIIDLPPDIEGTEAEVLHWTLVQETLSSLASLAGEKLRIAAERAGTQKT